MSLRYRKDKIGGHLRLSAKRKKKRGLNLLAWVQKQKELKAFREAEERLASYANEESFGSVPVNAMPGPSTQPHPYALPAHIPIQGSSGAAQNLYIILNTGNAQNVPNAGTKKASVGTQCNLIRKPQRTYQVKGRRIVDIDFLLKTLKEVNSHNEFGECSLNDVYIMHEVPAGLASCFSLKCVVCKYQKELWTEDPDDETKNMNADAVTGVLDISCSFDDMKQLFKKMAIPPITQTLFSKEYKKVSKNYKQDVEPAPVSSVVPETGTSRDSGRIVEIVQLGGLLMEHEIEIEQGNETKIDDPSKVILPQEIEVVGNEDRMVVDKEIPTESVEPIVKIGVDSEAEGKKLMVEPEIEFIDLTENMETSVNKVGCVSQHQAKPDNVAEKIKTSAFSDGRGQSLSKAVAQTSILRKANAVASTVQTSQSAVVNRLFHSYAKSSTEHAICTPTDCTSGVSHKKSFAVASVSILPILARNVSGVLKTQAGVVVPGPTPVIAGKNVFPNQVTPNVMPRMPGMSTVANGIRGTFPCQNAKTSVPVPKKIRRVFLYPTRTIGLAANAGSRMVLNHTASVPSTNPCNPPPPSKAIHGNTAVRFPKLPAGGTTKALAKKTVHRRINPVVPGTLEVKSNTHSNDKSGETSVAKDVTSVSNQGATRSSDHPIQPVAHTNSRSLLKIHDYTKPSFFTLPGGAPKDVNEATKPKPKSDKPYPGTKRICFRCDACDINFPKFEFLDSHKKSYCIKRLKIPPSSTITSDVLANSTADSAQNQRIVKTDSGTPTGVRYLPSAMSIIQSFVQCSVRTDLDAKYAINRHKAIQDRAQKAVKHLHDVLSITVKKINSGISLEEIQYMSDATTQALARVKTACRKEKHSLRTVERAVHRIKTSIDPQFFLATIGKQNGLATP